MPDTTSPPHNKAQDAYNKFLKDHPGLPAAAYAMIKAFFEMIYHQVF